MELLFIERERERVAGASYTPFGGVQSGAQRALLLAAWSLPDPFVLARWPVI